MAVMVESRKFVVSAFILVALVSATPAAAAPHSALSGATELSALLLDFIVGIETWFAGALDLAPGRGTNLAEKGGNTTTTTGGTTGGSSGGGSAGHTAVIDGLP